MSAEPCHLVFVYGTLKVGGSNHRFMEGQTFLAEARTVPGFRLIQLGTYPGMVAVPGGADFVVGEVWRIDPQCLAQLDVLEGIDEGLYRREKVNLLHPFTDQVVETYLYAQSIEGRPSIRDGRWIEPTSQ